MKKLFKDVANMSPITQKLDALLVAEDFSLLNADRLIGANERPIYSLGYIRGKSELVYIIAHEPLAGETIAGGTA